MLVVMLFSVPTQDSTAFQAEAATALEALAARPGHQGTRLGRSLDDPAAWTLVSEWATVGDYRRALSSYEVRVAATRLLGRARSGPTAFEVLRTDGPQGVTTAASDRSPEGKNGAAG